MVLLRCSFATLKKRRGHSPAPFVPGLFDDQNIVDSDSVKSDRDVAVGENVGFLLKIIRKKHIISGGDGDPEEHTGLNNMETVKEIRTELLPTSQTSDRHPIHKWFNFVAGYSPEYVEIVIEDYSRQHGKYPVSVLDPFAGCGTTSVVANEMGIESMGIERNPFFYKIGYTKANAEKTIPFLPDIAADFRTACLREAGSSADEFSTDARKYLLKMFADSDLRRLLDLRKIVETYRGYKYFMGYTFLSKMLEFITTAKTDGIYKVPTSTKKGMSVQDAVSKSERIILDGSRNVVKTKSRAEYIYDSSVEFDIPKNRFDLVVFSPPYLNNFDFAEMTRMQFYFWNEADSWSDISEKHRNHMLVNTTTALKPVRKPEVQNAYKRRLPDRLQSRLEPIVSELRHLFHDEKRSKDYYRIIYPYLGQMKTVLEKCFRGLKKGGEFHIVVSDAAFYGIHIDTQEYLSDLGAIDVSIDRMRNRGERWLLDKRAKSNKQLGEYEIVANKEL